MDVSTKLRNEIAERENKLEFTLKDGYARSREKGITFSACMTATLGYDQIEAFCEWLKGLVKEAK